MTTRAFRHVTAAEPGALRPLRRSFHQWLLNTGCPMAVIDDAVLAISELFTNALEAGAREIRVSAGVVGSSIELAVEDDGPDWDPPRADLPMPDPLVPRGRGLALLARLGNLRIDRFDDVTSVVLSMPRK